MKKYQNNKIVAIVIFTFIISSCMVGPNFQKVEVESPEEYRFQEEEIDTTSQANWREIFLDSTLTALIDSALLNNFDVQISASRVQESRHYLGYAKADMYPKFSYGGNGSIGNTLGGFPSGESAVGSFSANANLNWELVFWGKYRRATESAKAELAASEFGYAAIQVSLISEVANAYYSLLDFKNRLETAKRTLATRTESLRIIRERFDKGIIPEIDLNQAQMQEAYAAGAIPLYERSVAFSENALSVLIGENPKGIITESDIQTLAIPKTIPVGLPSQLLTRRPDIMEAEQMVVAQNARIGVAQSMRFPSISLTGLIGLASPDLSAFNSSDALIGTAGAGLFGPIFHFGKNKRRVDIEKERTEQMKLNYEKAVVSAFRETEDALINIRTLEQELVFVTIQMSSSGNAAKLSKARYDGGVSSYLEVLEAERTLFEIELYHSDLLQRRMKAYVSLFKTLGGGWNATPENEETAKE